MEKCHISIVAIGHIDSGKDTLLSRIINEPKYEFEYKRATERSSFQYAFVLEKLRIERERALTIKSSYYTFATTKFHFTCWNTPGHRDFIKNMIWGTFQADCALLIVGASNGEFEAGISQYGQTREYPLISFTVGVKQLIVVVNKMDCSSVNYSQSRFDEIQNELSAFLKKVGYNPDKITFVPISAWHGDNVREKSANLSWWKGPTLLEALDSLQRPNRLTNKPLRIPIHSIHNIRNDTVFVGTIVTGVLRTGMSLSISSVNKTVQVKSIQMNRQTVEEAKAGDHVGFAVEGISRNEVKRGLVVGNTFNIAPREVDFFVAQIVFLYHNKEMRTGYTPVIYIHTAMVSCRIVEILAKVDKRTGKELEKNPTLIKNGEAFVVRLMPLTPLCIEEFKDFPPLGRFVVRDMKQTIGAGVVREVIRKPN